MKTFLTSLMIIVSTVAYTQGVRTFNQEEANLRKAKEFYKDGKYGDAIPLLQQAVGSGNENQDVIYMLASSYAYEEEYEKAAPQYEKLFLLNPNYSLEAIYESGFAYSELKQFDRAITQYQMLLKNATEPEKNERYIHRAKYKLHYAQEQKALMKNSDQLKAPVKLSDVVNTKYPEYLPMLDPTGRKLYFTSDRKGGISNELEDDVDYDEDLFYIEKKKVFGVLLNLCQSQSIQLIMMEPRAFQPMVR